MGQHGRRPIRAGLVLLPLLLALLAGCSGTDAPQEEQPGTVDQVIVDDGTRVDANRSVLTGRVHDPVDFSVQGARVFLLRAPHHDVTDGQGRFRFEDVAPGQRVLRVEASDFRVAEVTVTLEPGKRTDVSVELEYKEARAGGRLPHRHDLWDGQQTHVMMDHAVDLNEDPRGNFLTGLYPTYSTATWPNLNSTYPIFPPHDGDAPPIVLPGTERMEVTLSWDSQTITVDEFGFLYVTANSTDEHALGPRGPGGSWSIPVRPDQTDNGHQQWTFWEFGIFVPDKQYAAGDQPDVIRGSVHVQIVLHRGDVVMDSPHRDWWEDNTTMVLRDSTPETVSNGGLTPRGNPEALSFSLEDGVLVPPGAERMRIELWYNNTRHEALDKDIVLKWRVGDQHPHATKVDAMHTVDPEVDAVGHKVYDFPLDSSDTDQFYQSKTNWMWRLTFPDDESNPYIVMEAWEVSAHVQVWR